MQHTVISPSILYWGTPVVLISTNNADGTPNLAPMSSAFWLGDRCMLGLLGCSQTTVNLLRTKQCTLNMPSDNMVRHVNGLARTTGSADVPDIKLALGYLYDKDKFGSAGLTPEPSQLVLPPRVLECPVQMEAELVAAHDMQGPGPAEGFTLALEVRILRTYVTDDLRMPGYADRVDPDAWKPMIMSFQRLYGLKGATEASRLADIDEDLYRR